MYYLREDVYFEPLFNQWYAWPYLIAPVQGARHTVNTHQRIMKSFVNNYQLHIMACKEPGMAGGEFLDCTEEQVEDINSLISFIDHECKDLVELSSAVKELDEMLRLHTSGESIEGLYEHIPEPLKGYVELFFDMEHNPSYRLLESLLYKSKYFKPELQSISFGILSEVGERPFVLSTPRLPDEKHIHLNLTYDSPVLDRILKSREIPLSKEEMDSIFASLECKGGLHYEKLFTSTPSSYSHKPVEKGLRLQYTGHAGFLVETPGVAVLIDPVIASRGEQYADEVLSFNELPPKIDFICITHSHQDHANIETLLQLRYKTDRILVPKNNGGSLADPSLKLLFQNIGFKVIEVEDLDEFILGDSRIQAIPFLGEHGDLNIRTKSAWLFAHEGKKVFFGADSSNLDINMYSHLQKIVGNVDLIAIGMECVGAPYTWLYGALHTKRVGKNIKNSRRLNGSDSVQALEISKIFGAKEVYIYALGLEPWYKYFMGVDYDDESTQIVESNKMIEECMKIGIPCQSMFGRHTKEF